MLAVKHQRHVRKARHLHDRMHARRLRIEREGQDDLRDLCTREADSPSARWYAALRCAWRSLRWATGRLYSPARSLSKGAEIPASVGGLTVCSSRLSTSREILKAGAHKIAPCVPVLPSLLFAAILCGSSAADDGLRPGEGRDRRREGHAVQRLSSRARATRCASPSTTRPISRASSRSTTPATCACPLIGQVKAGGHTARQLEGDVGAALSDGYVNNRA